MKKNKVILILISAACLTLLSGCGKKMYDLTDEEQDIIVRYVAHVLGEYNIYQKDGMTCALPEEPGSESPGPEGTENSESESEGGALSPGSSPGGSIASGDSVTLAELLGGADGLTVKYEGLEVAEVYMQGGYYSLDAGKNYRYAVLKFSASNTGKSEIDVDTLKRKMTFSLTLKDGSAYTTEPTILPDDLATYKGSIAAGESQNLVLLFRIPKTKADQTEQIRLHVTENKIKKAINL